MAYFNYGTPAGADPRTYYAPRDVGGRLATWQANPGRLLDYQTGTPLSERFSAAPAAPREMVYGDSYGGVQGAEQAQLNAINALVMQQRQMQQAAQEAAMNRALADRKLQQDERVNRFNMMVGMDKSALDRQLRRDALAIRDQDRLDRLAMNDEDNLTKLDVAGLNADAKAEKVAGNLRSVGSSIATDLSRLIPQASSLQKLVLADDTMLESARNALEAAGNTIQKTPGGFFIRTPGPNTLPPDKDKDLIAINSAIKAAPLATQRAQDLQAIIKSLDSTFADAGKYGFQVDPATGFVSHPEAGLKFRINAPSEPSAPSGRTAQTNAVAAPMASKVQRGPADIVYNPVTKTRK